MKPKDIFTLAVRILGLVFLYHGLMALPAIISVVFAGPSVGNFISIIIMILWPLFVARWLIGGAPLLVNLAFPDKGVVEKSVD